MCLSCQKMYTKSASDPIRLSSMPQKPWEIIHIDLCGPLPTGESRLVLMDACSRWVEVPTGILRSTTSDVLVKQLMRIFLTYDFPELITTDNDPQFASKTSLDFLEAHGIQHWKITPYWPQANAEVERFNQPFEKIIRAAHIERKDWWQEMYKFLLNYSATSHAVTGIAPCQLMFGRETRTIVPQLRKPEMTKAFIFARRNDLVKKRQQKAYANGCPWGVLHPWKKEIKCCFNSRPEITCQCDMPGSCTQLWHRKVLVLYYSVELIHRSSETYLIFVCCTKLTATRAMMICFWWHVCKDPRVNQWHRPQRLWRPPDYLWDHVLTWTELVSAEKYC